jgi:hypothetical protein
VKDAVVWAQPPGGNDPAAEEDRDEKEGELDESFAMRRLRRWLSGMFGVPSRDPDENG